MRETAWVWIVLAIGLVTVPSATAIGSAARADLPVARAGDAGLYNVTGFTAKGKAPPSAHGKVSLAFELGEQTRIADAYGEQRTVHELRTAIVDSSVEPMASSWIDRRGLDPVTVDVASRENHTYRPVDDAPPVTRTNATSSWSAYASRAQNLTGLSCGLFQSYQGTTLDEDDRLTDATVGGQVPSRDVEHASLTFEVAEVQRLEDAASAARVHLSVNLPNASFSADVWHRSDVPYPLSASIEGHLPDQTRAERSHTVEHLRPWLGWSIAGALLDGQDLGTTPTTTIDGDTPDPLDPIRFEYTAVLERFQRGDGATLAAVEEREWANRHALAETRDVTRWGPVASGAGPLA